MFKELQELYIEYIIILHTPINRKITMHSKKPQNKFGTKKNRKINFALQEPQNQLGASLLG